MTNYNTFNSSPSLTTNISDANTTVFNDVKIAQFTPQAGWRFNYSINTDLVAITTVGSGTITKSAVSPVAILSTGSTANSAAQVNSKKNLVYTPGMGIRLNFTCSFSSAIANTKQIIGFGDNSDGLFFGYNGVNFGVLRRSSSSGILVDNWILQSNWNQDHMDGTGPSQLTLNTSVDTVYQIESQWLGYGIIVYSIENPYTGGFTPVHKIYYADTSLYPNLTTPNLPCMARVENGTTTNTVTLQTACSILGVEGIPNYAITTMNSVSATNDTIGTTEEQVLAIQNNTLSNSIQNRTPIRLQFLSCSQVPQNTATRGTFTLYYDKVISGTLVNVNSINSVVSYTGPNNTLGSSGKALLSFQMVGNSAQIIDLDPYNISLNPGDTVVISCVFSAGTTNDATAALNWVEYY